MPYASDSRMLKVPKVKDARRQHGIGLALDHAPRQNARAYPRRRSHITGIGTARATARVSPWVKAGLASRSMQRARSRRRRDEPPPSAHATASRCPWRWTARREDLPLVGTGYAGQTNALGIDRHDHGLAAKRRGSWLINDESRTAAELSDTFVGTGGNHGAHARRREIRRPRYRGWPALGRMRRHLDGRRAVIARGGNVQKTTSSAPSRS